MIADVDPRNLRSLSWRLYLDTMRPLYGWMAKRPATELFGSSTNEKRNSPFSRISLSTACNCTSGSPRYIGLKNPFSETTS